MKKKKINIIKNVRNYKVDANIDVEDSFVENCPKDHACCFLDGSISKTDDGRDFKHKKFQELFYLPLNQLSENFRNGGDAFIYFFGEVNSKKKKPKYKGWTDSPCFGIGKWTNYAYFYNFEKNLFEEFKYNSNPIDFCKENTGSKVS